MRKSSRSLLQGLLAACNPALTKVLTKAPLTFVVELFTIAISGQRNGVYVMPTYSCSPTDSNTYLLDFRISYPTSFRNSLK